MRAPPQLPKYDDPVTDAHLLGIGRIVMRWAITERVVMDSLWEIATGHSFEQLGAEASISLALVTGMDARVMLGLLKAVFRARHPADADVMDKLVERLDKLGKRRNAIAHGRWIAGRRPGTIETATFKSAGRLAVDRHAFTSAELNALAERIMRRTWELADFLQSRGYWKPPKPAEESLSQAP
jgi:hypothetical protein